MKVVTAEKGQGLLEYALILVMVAVVVFVVLATLGPAIGNLFSDLNSDFQDISFVMQML
ncbi:MAG: pilus assembly protein [Anaerolinea sp. 4484_236]|nr:MAG: pilus assembly protein [Anaerolinea sp. 4484_236]OQY28310.1 MAG: pilus assembly protein [Anaerolineaceae bacterium 4572_5.2]